MSEIKTISLEDFQEDVTPYKSQKVRIKEFQFFSLSDMLYDDYYLQVGPRGGVIVCYGKNKKLSVGHCPFVKGGAISGVEFRTSGSWCASTIFPPAHKLPRLLAVMERGLAANLKQYKKTYDSAKTRLEKVQKLSEEYPEYSL